MRRAAAVFIIILFAMTAEAAGTLKLGYLASNPAGSAQGKAVGKFLTRSLKGDTYTSFKIYSESKPDIKAFVSLIQREKLDVVIASIYQAAYYAANTEMEPALLVELNGSVYVRSLITVRKDSGIHNIQDLKGRVIIFKDAASSASYFLPKGDLTNQGLKLMHVKYGQKAPAGSVGYVFTNDKYHVANSVYVQKADAGAVSSEDWDSHQIIQPFIRKSLRIIYETDSIPGMFIMLRKDMPDSIKSKITAALTEINNNKYIKKSFAKLNITGFYKADFDWRQLFRELPGGPAK